MSRIYFHSEDEDAALRGSERAHFAVLSLDIAFAIIGNPHYAKDWLLPLLPADAYIRQAFTERGLQNYLAWHSLIVDGQEIDFFGIALNTLLAIGGDPLKLVARLHGQCEIHCWVSGGNRRWLAAIMRRGRKCGLYRSDQGWESVIDLLERDDGGPVVCSYSVTNSFPNFDCLPETHSLKRRDDEERVDDFWELPPAEMWSACVDGLKARHGLLELRPDDWNDYRIQTGFTAFDLVEHGQKMRAERQAATG